MGKPERGGEGKRVEGERRKVCGRTKREGRWRDSEKGKRERHEGSNWWGSKKKRRGKRGGGGAREEPRKEEGSGEGRRKGFGAFFIQL